MSFISYAQNFEDVMLWRALKNVDAGLYIDVGAQHPTVDSVSKAFHERGWRGVHIEPVRKFADLLRAERPGDTVLEIALGEHDGTLSLNVLDTTGLSTAVDRYALRHHDTLGLDATRVEVPQRTLASALGELVGQQVHWLKIDVEGFELEVLKGWDPSLLRPWIIVVEATEPGSPTTDYAAWEPILLAAGYAFVYFDGLNRFYIAPEHPELAAAFNCPPNVFDQFTLSGKGSWELCRTVSAEVREQIRQQHRRFAEVCGARLRQQQQQLADLGQAAAQSRRLADERAETVRLLRASTSWRMTAPLRAGGSAARWLLRRASSLMSAAAGVLHPLPSPAGAVAHPVPGPVDSTLRTLSNQDEGMRSVPGRSQGMLRSLPSQGVGVLRSLAKRPLVWSMRQVMANPALTSRALGFLKRRPRLKQFVHQLAIRAGLVQRHSAQSPPARPAPLVGTGEMSARAERLYRQLQDAVDARKH